MPGLLLFIAGTRNNPSIILRESIRGVNANRNRCLFSAGVGRTGTYIVIDAMLKQAKCKNEVNVFGFLKHIRTQRNFLVQTEEQYVFIHHALQEAIESGETNIEENNLLEYVQDMLSPNNTNTDAWNNLEAQYKVVHLYNKMSYSPDFLQYLNSFSFFSWWLRGNRKNSTSCPRLNRAIFIKIAIKT